MEGRIDTILMCVKLGDDPISSLDFSFIWGVPLNPENRVQIFWKKFLEASRIVDNKIMTCACVYVFVYLRLCVSNKDVHKHAFHVNQPCVTLSYHENM